MRVNRDILKFDKMGSVEFSLSNLKFDSVENRVEFFGKFDTKIRQNFGVLKFDKREVVELSVEFLVEIHCAQWK